MNINWTPYQDDILKQHYLKKGYSAKIIGEILGKSRHSVIGRAHRLGLSMKIEDVRVVNHKKKLDKKQKEVTKKVHKKVIKTQPIKEEVVMRTVRLIDVKENQCREIIGEPKNLKCCGRIIVNGKSYCDKHFIKNTVKTTFSFRPSPCV